MDFKKRIEQSVLKLHEREHKKNQRAQQPRKKNGKPEDAVVDQLIQYFKKHSATFSIHRVESKAVYNASAGRYLEGQTDPGFPDLCGCDDTGRALWIEVKAPGQRATVRPAQELFLKDKIEKRCFAVVVDSVALFEKLYASFILHGEQKTFLLENLPKSKLKARLESDNFDLFD